MLYNYNFSQEEAAFVVQQYRQRNLEPPEGLLAVAKADMGQGPLDVSAYSLDELKAVRGFTSITGKWRIGDRTRWRENYAIEGLRQFWFEIAPWLWNLPRNEFEFETLNEVASKRDWVAPGEKDVVRRIAWSGRALMMKDPGKYLAGLQLQRSPSDYIKYLKMAQVAGFTTERSDRYSGRLLPDDAHDEWWKQVLSAWSLGVSFDLLRAAQIEDRPDLEAVYNWAGNLVTALHAEINNPVPIEVLPFHPTEDAPYGDYRDNSISFRISLELKPWQKEKLRQGIEHFRSLIAESRRPMAQRIVELSDSDATIAATSFSLDPLQNPYLVYNQQKSESQGAPVFTNIARNQSSSFSPADVVGSPASMKYWLQVPEYERQQARIYDTPLGPMSAAELRQYGLDRQAKKFNILPWAAAGTAVAILASEVL